MRVKFITFIVIIILIAIVYNIYSVTNMRFSKFGVSIQGPGGWVKSRINFNRDDMPSHKVGTLVKFTDLGELSEAKIVQIVVMGWKDPELSLSQIVQQEHPPNYVKNFVSYGKTDFKNFEINPFENIVINGLSGLRTTANFTENGFIKSKQQGFEPVTVKCKALIYVFLKNNLAVYIEARANDNLFDKYKPVFEKSISTLKIK